MTIKTETTCDISDILYVAMGLGYTWNNAIDILYKQHIGDFTDSGSHEVSASEYDTTRPYHCDCVDTCKIMSAFFTNHNLKHVKIVDS